LVAKFLITGNADAKTNSHDAQNIRGFGLTHLYSSLMHRAVQTAMYIGNEIGLQPIAHAHIHEHGGIYLANPQTGVKEGRPGKPRSFFERHYPQLQLPEWLDERGWWQNRPFETWDDCYYRASVWLRDLVQKHGNTDDRVAMVSHGAFFGALMRVLLKMPDYHAHPGWFSHNNCAISRIDFTPKEILVVYVNRAHYLPHNLIT
jgi:2,3-bisphosphoglycerate-dependent phosphoglycerate mutase